MFVASLKQYILFYLLFFFFFKEKGLHLSLLYLFLFFIFGHTAHGISVPWPGIKLLPAAVEVWSLNH